MAASPPPYSQQEAIRAQRQAQRAAERARRDYWRAMRRPSIVGPILLIAIGVVALLVELGRLSVFAVWDWYIRWWPALLVLIGLISLGEWWWDRDNPYGRRHNYGGVIALLVLLALVGYANFGIHRFGGFDNHVDNDWVLNFFGHEHENDTNLNLDLPSGALLEIQVPSGDVTLTPSGDSQIHVQSHETVHIGNDSEALRALEKIRPQLTVNGKSATLRTGDQNNGRVDLTIEIPADAIARITADRGDVTAEDLKTALTVTAGNGDVKLTNLHASADVRMSKGDFEAHSINGDVSLQGRLDDVAITEIHGRVLLDGDFFGDTHIAGVDSQVHVRSSRTGIEIANLPGDLTLNSDNLQVDNAVGPVTITTRANDVVCTRIAGDARLENQNGEISLVANEPGAIQIHNHNGKISLTLPASARFTLQAIARNGDIHSEFNLPVVNVGSGQSASGSVGEGAAKIELTADHGNIEISKLSTAVPPAPPTPPAPPSPPPPPGDPGSARNIPHLRAPKEGVPRPQTQ